MKKSTKSKKTDPQKVNIDKHKDGDCAIPEEFVENYKTIYYSTEHDGKTLFPFIYLTMVGEPLNQKCTLLIKKNEYIQKKKGKKFLSSL